MKQTIDVSIAGIAFSMDTEAYGLLKEYLDRIEQGYKNDTDGAEIIADIEARICELILGEQGPEELVPAERIRRIISQMGSPDDISEQPIPAATVENTERLARRLYRNPEGAKLGGVCSGLGTYFSVEPVLIRLCFVAPLVLTPLMGVMHLGRLAGFSGTLFGSFVMLYMLLWFAIPKAKTPRQKLEMRGEKVTASSIRENFQQDFKDVSASPKNERSASIWADLVYIFGRIVLFFVKFVVGCVAFGLAFGAAILLMMCLGLLFGAPVHIGGSNVLGNLPGGMTYVYLGLLAAFLILGGVSYMLWGLIFDKPFPKKTLSVMGGLGAIVLLFVVIMTASYWDRWEWRDRSFRPRIDKTTLPQRDSTWVEEVRIGDSVIRDTVKVEYFDYQ